MPQLKNAKEMVRNPLWVSLALFLAGQLVLVLLAPLSRATTADSIFQGIVLLSSDSPGYLRNGSSWGGVGSETWNRWAFLSVIRIGEALGSGALFLVAVHALLFLFAGAALVDLGRRYSGRVAGVIAASVLLVNPMVAQWVRFVHTEAMFYALVVLAIWVTERYSSNRKFLVPLLLIAGLVAMTRPNGVLVGAACLTFVGMSHFRGLPRWLSSTAVWTAAVVMLLLGLTDATPRYGWDTATYTVEGVVIEGAEHARTSIPMPTPTSAVNSNSDLMRYVVDNPVATGRLAVTRIWVETVQVRRHYPALVNYGVGFFMIVFVFAVGFGLFDLRRERLSQIVLLIAIPLALLIGVTFAVAEGRFGWAYLLAFSVHAGAGAARLVAFARPMPSQTPS